ncbi:MAG: ATP-binding cassette domain-containing protein [Candidatus Aminicenantes bacterium]|nr:ATP-binding cassette domain-containing protein [Candidatus Aminicenantes bacterium]
MLEIRNLFIEVEGKPILKGINLTVAEGETIILFGPNGVGKSSLFMAIMGFPKYKIKKGQIIFKGTDITHLPASDRARMGIGMSFQRPPSIKGIKLNGLSEIINSDKDNGDRIDYYSKMLKLDQHLKRDINLGFSGGEVKRSEIFQLLLQNPLLSLIDEPESGVDVENISILGKAIKRLLHKEDRLTKRRNSGIIITHTGLILNYLNADMGYMLIDGCLTCSGNAREIFELIQKQGYRECQNCLKKK